MRKRSVRIPKPRGKQALEKDIRGYFTTLDKIKKPSETPHIPKSLKAFLERKEFEEREFKRLKKKYPHLPRFDR